MAKLYFYYSAMNAGKTTLMLQSNHNYQERGMNTLMFTFDLREGPGVITSHIGLKGQAIPVEKTLDFFAHVQEAHQKKPVHCTFVDEAQFLTKDQVRQLTKIADHLDIPVLTYGLRSDFRGEPFEGSLYLLSWADKLHEVKTICPCGSKATMNARLDSKGQRILEGPQVEWGWMNRYASFCRHHFWSPEDLGI